MFHELKRGLAFTAVTMLLFGGGYHLVVWGIGRVAFADQADGSLIRRADGAVVGSRLIAQPFARAEYFWPRPSAVDYNAAASGGSNLGPTNPDQRAAVRARLMTVVAREGVVAATVPSEIVTTSGSGLDPHIPPSAARLQARRVATARSVPVEQVMAIVDMHVEAPSLGVFGRARVNVLEVNLALDRRLGRPSVK